MGAGIQIEPAALPRLHAMVAAGSYEAHVLAALLERGASCDEVSIGPEDLGTTTIAWDLTDKGLPVIVVYGPTKTLAALVVPFSPAQIERRRDRGESVDSRGALPDAQDLTPWWPADEAEEPRRVDAYNARVLKVADLTGTWHPRTGTP